jgi:serine/threonine-protein kinase SIK3
MLVVEPERRLSISQILAHQWMGGDGHSPDPELVVEHGSPEMTSQVSPQLNQLVIESMLTLPDLDADTLLQAVQGNAFNHVSAIYNLLVDQLESAVTSVPSIQTIPGGYMPDDAHQLEKVIIARPRPFDHSSVYFCCQLFHGQ